MASRGREKGLAFDNKLYVGGLPADLGDSDLYELFSPYGEIESTIVMKGPDGRSRSFGFVRFLSIEGVDTAMKGRSEVKTRGRTLEIRRAFPRETPSEQQVTSAKLFVGGCRGGVNDEALRQYFSKYGTVLSAEVIKDKNGETRGFGFVEFEDWDATDKIILEGEHRICGRVLEIRKYINRDHVDKKINPDGGYRGVPPPYLSSPPAYGGQPPPLPVPHASVRHVGNTFPEFESDRPPVPIWDRLFGLTEEERARELIQVDDEYFIVERDRLERQLRELDRLENERRRVIERMRDRAGPSYRERSPVLRNEYHPQHHPSSTIPEYHHASYQPEHAAYAQPLPPSQHFNGNYGGEYRSTNRDSYRPPIPGAYRR